MTGPPPPRRQGAFTKLGPGAIALVAAGKIDLERLVTSAHRLEEAEEALTAGTSSTSATNCISRLSAVIPPSTRSVVGAIPESAAARSIDWIDSGTSGPYGGDRAFDNADRGLLLAYVVTP